MSELPTSSNDLKMLSDRLDSVLFQFINLYERWSEDRQLAVKQSAAIAKLVQALADEINTLTQLQNTLPSVVSRQVEMTLTEEIKDLAKTFTKVTHKETDTIAKRLSSTADKVQYTLSLSQQQFEAQEQFAFWTSSAITVVTTLLASILIVKLLMPAPTSPLTNEQLATYQQSQLLQSFWPKLTKKEQERLLLIGQGKKVVTSKNPVEDLDVTENETLDN